MVVLASWPSRTMSESVVTYHALVEEKSKLIKFFLKFIFNGSVRSWLFFGFVAPGWGWNQHTKERRTGETAWVRRLSPSEPVLLWMSGYVSQYILLWVKSNSIWSEFSVTESYKYLAWLLWSTKIWTWLSTTSLYACYVIDHLLFPTHVLCFHCFVFIHTVTAQNIYPIYLSPSYLSKFYHS